MVRRSFLWGHLSGLVLGAALMGGGLWLYQPAPQTVQPVTIHPISAPPAGTLYWQPRDDMDSLQQQAIPPAPAIPPDWQQDEFNGRPVYIIPLTSR
jgi:hypothetical protein